jgi:selenocysteine lyase/cysteine desulfurase
MKLDRIRSAFPYLSECTYLNTAKVGLSWSGQGRAAAAFYELDKAQGSEGAMAWAAKTDATKTQLAHLINVPSACIQFVGSTTEALHLVAASLPLRRGDQVVLAADEFPSVMEVWQSWSQRGISLVRVPIPQEIERTDLLCAAVNSQTRVLAVSHVHWRTGTRVDLSRLHAVCAEHDCRLIVDGVQALGAIPVEAGLADAYCASVFKWLLAGFGLGILALSERLASELTPAVRGYANPAPSRSLRYGHVNFGGVYALHGTLDYLNSLGFGNIHARLKSLAQYALHGLVSRGFDVITPHTALAGIVSIRHAQAPEVCRALAGQGIIVEDGEALIRASPHFYNTEGDIDRFIAALDALGPAEGRRTKRA